MCTPGDCGSVGESSGLCSKTRFLNVALAGSFNTRDASNLTIQMQGAAAPSSSVRPRETGLEDCVGVFRSRLRGGFDLDEAHIERLRQQRYGDGFGKGTDLDSSGIFESGEDSLVVLEGNESEERARAEKERRGLLRAPKSSQKNEEATVVDADQLSSFGRVILASAIYLHTHTICVLTVRTRRVHTACVCKHIQRARNQRTGARLR